MKTINENQAIATILEIGATHGLSNDQTRERIKLDWYEVRVIRGKNQVSQDLWNDLQKAFPYAEYPGFRFEEY